MKRANETPAFPGHASDFTDAAPDLRTSQQPTPSTASTGTTAGIQPGITSMNARTNARMWPAAPLPLLPQARYLTHPNYQPQPQAHATVNGVALLPVVLGIHSFPSGQPPLSAALTTQLAAAPDKPPGDHANRDIFSNTTLNLQVKDVVSTNSKVWMRTVIPLKGQERTDFLIVSFFQIAMKHGSNWHWNDAISRIMDIVGMDAMLAQRWPKKKSLLHILAEVKDHRWLAQALTRDSALLSLRLNDEQGWSPLHIAASCGKKKIVQTILNHDDEAGSLRLEKTNKKDENFTPLYLACRGSHRSTVVLLLGSNGKEQRLSASVHGYLPIHTALGCSTNGLQHLLAECAIEQVSAQGAHGRNALMIAVHIGSHNTVKLLLDVPGTLTTQLCARDNDGRGALDHARMTGNAKVIAQIEAAIQNLTTASSSSTTSTSATVAVVTGVPQGPVPLTPDPTSLAAEYDVGFSDTEVEADQQ